VCSSDLPGDVLAVGVAAGAPRARAGQRVSIAIEGVGELTHTLVAPADAAAPNPAAAPLTSTAPTGRVARVAFDGAIHAATPHPDGVQLADGRVLAETDVVWLPPFEVGTVIALGLNYADHVKELSKELTVTAKDEPLAFLKSASGLLGHRAHTHRPADVAFMHYECELAVVIGRTAKNVRREDAMAHVAGYTVANDYAIRDYLENYYRPNLRVKNRDGCTVLGPWFVPASEVPDPHTLALRTLVNGVETQHGHTADLISDIPALIEYLSGFMTLQPGDVILTGTPDGVVNVNAGDEVVTEIDGIGRLVNTLCNRAANH
jgi:5-oxopent-3-ene-1,2,5-tricarboxylate decarboxylase/2-hydroxyhepta-2,4-diene-1,7-dioate isomerase